MPRIGQWKLFSRTKNATGHDVLYTSVYGLATWISMTDNAVLEYGLTRKVTLAVRTPVKFIKDVIGKIQPFNLAGR